MYLRLTSDSPVFGFKSSSNKTVATWTETFDFGCFTHVGVVSINVSPFENNSYNASKSMKISSYGDKFGFNVCFFKANSSLLIVI